MGSHISRILGYRSVNLVTERKDKIVQPSYQASDKKIPNRSYHCCCDRFCVWSANSRFWLQHRTLVVPVWIGCDTRRRICHLNGHFECCPDWKSGCPPPDLHCKTLPVIILCAIGNCWASGISSEFLKTRHAWGKWDRGRRCCR